MLAVTAQGDQDDDFVDSHGFSLWDAGVMGVERGDEHNRGHVAAIRDTCPLGYLSVISSTELMDSVGSTLSRLNQPTEMWRAGLGILGDRVVETPS